MSDACCGPDDGSPAADDDGPVRLWQVRELQLSAAAGALLKSKPTTVALGNLAQLPYGDEI